MLSIFNLSGGTAQSGRSHCSIQAEPLLNFAGRADFAERRTHADRGKLFKIIKMLYGLMGLQFSEEAEPMDADPAVLEYFIFSFTADFGEIIKDYLAEA